MKYHERCNSLTPSDKRKIVLQPFDLEYALDIFTDNQDIDDSVHEDCEENLRRLR